MSKIRIEYGNKTIELDASSKVPIQAFIEGCVAQEIFEFIGEKKKYRLRVTKDKKLILT